MVSQVSQVYAGQAGLQIQHDEPDRLTITLVQVATCSVMLELSVGKMEFR